MKIHDLQQGTPEWHEHRASHFNASDAPAMMGASPYCSRQELLHRMKTGEQMDVSPQLQRVFDKGHDVERQARPIIERQIGEDLFPVTGSAVVDGLPLGTSLDGFTMDETIVWECKQMNTEKADLVREQKCPPQDWWQVQQQLLVSGANVCIYSVTDGTEDGTISIEVKPDQEAFAELIKGWKRFAQDLEEYEPKASAPAPVGVSPQSLPALRIELTGMVTASNLQEYRDHAVAVFESVSTDLQTDQDFADAAEAVKFCGDVERRLEQAKQDALDQTQSISELFRAIDDIKDAARSKRLELNKLVEARKKAVRIEIAKEAENALADEHAASLKAIAAIENVSLPMPRVDFYAPMQGKRSVDKMRDGVADELSKAKGELRDTERQVLENLQVLRDLAGDDRTLAPDLTGIITKDTSDFANLLKARIAERDEAERKRQEAEVARKAAEEARRAEQEARRIEREQAQEAVSQQRAVQVQREPEAVAEKAPQEQAKTPVSRSAAAGTQYIPERDYPNNAKDLPIVLAVTDDGHVWAGILGDNMVCLSQSAGSQLPQGSIQSLDSLGLLRQKVELRQVLDEGLNA